MLQPKDHNTKCEGNKNPQFSGYFS
jgi:hypothetical protein